MSFQIIIRPGRERARRIERVIQQYGQQRVNIDQLRDEPRRKPPAHIMEESRAKLEKRGFGRRD